MSHYPDGAAYDPRAPWNDDELDDYLEPDPDYLYETARDEALE